MMPTFRLTEELPTNFRPAAARSANEVEAIDISDDSGYVSPSYLTQIATKHKEECKTPRVELNQ